MSTIMTEFSDRANGRVAHLRVCNPDKLNVLGAGLMAQMTMTLHALGADKSVRAIVLEGEGARAFIGGADINEMARLEAPSARAFISTLHGVCTAIRSAPVPVIARMHGYTLGAGLEIAAACDLRIAADDSVMGMPEVKIGIPSVIEAALLPMLIGWGRTRWLLLTGETIDADTALRWGLVEQVVPTAGLDAALGVLLDQILSCGPNALKLQKRLIAEWEELPPSAAIERGIDCFAESWKHEEPVERMAAFLAAKAMRKKA